MFANSQQKSMDRIHQITTTLTHACSYMLVTQMSQGWGWSLRRAQQAASAFVEEGLLGQLRATVPPLLALERPLHVWRPGDAAPDFGALSYRARRRWQSQAVPTVVYYATNRAAALFGGCAGKAADQLKARHETHMTELYLRFRERRPEVENLWYRGDVANRFGLTDDNREPDAFLFCPCGGVEWAVEFISSYSSLQIRAFHEFCKDRYAYQLW